MTASIPPEDHREAEAAPAAVTGNDDGNPLCAECSPQGIVEEMAYAEWEQQAWGTAADDDQHDYGFG